jgi:hypothetical protein
MKVRIYKSGGTTGRFISKLEKFTSLPQAAMGAQVDQEKELKLEIAKLIDDKNVPSNAIVSQLVNGGYNYQYAKGLVDDVLEDIEEGYYSSKSKRGKKQSMLDSELIASEDEKREKKKLELEEEENQDRKARKQMSANMQNDIQQTAEDTEAEDEDDEAYDEEYMNAGSPYDEASEEGMELATAQYGAVVDEPMIQWPGMQMDLNTMRYGGVPDKKKFIKSTVKQLRKAEMGMQKNPSIGQQPNPYGTINNPLGDNLTPNKSLVSAIKNTAQNFADEERYKQEAENMYNQQFMQPMAEAGGADNWSTNLHNYGEALQHMMPNINASGMNTSFDGQEMSFGGSSRRIRRANRALFGLPTAPPFVNTEYEFGPLGGVRKSQATYDMSKMAEMLKANPNLLNMFMPKIATGNQGGFFNNFGMSSFPYGFNQGFSSGYTTRTVSSAPTTRLKWVTQTINNAADPGKNHEAANLNNNPDLTDKKKKYQEYINEYNYDAQQNPLAPNMARQAPITFEEFTAKGEDGLSEYDWWVKTRSPQAKSSTTEVKNEAPKNKDVQSKSNSSNKSSKPKSNNSSSVSNKSSVNDPDAKVAPPSKPVAEPKKVTPPEVKSWHEDSGSGDLDYWELIKTGAKMLMPGLGGWFEDGGFVDFERPDLNRFIYGGNEYEYGGSLRQFNPGGEQIDLKYKDARGMNYQDYMNRYNEMAADTRGGKYDPKTTNRAAPQTWAEWKAEQEAEKNPQGTNTNTATNFTSNTGTGTNTGTGATTYDQAYFTKLFQSDPNAKKGFEDFLRSQGVTPGTQTQQQQQNQGNMVYTNRAGNPVVGAGPANQNFGSMLGNMFGFNKDFKYFTSPQGQITAAMIGQMMKDPTKQVTQTSYKDRGKWFNPFDTKKITKWEVMNGAGNAAGTNNQGVNNQGANNQGTQGPGNAPGYQPGAFGPGYSGYNADANGNKIPDYLEVGSENKGTASSVTGPSSLNTSNNANASSIQPNVNPSGRIMSKSSGSGIASVYEPEDMGMTSNQGSQNVNASQKPAYNTLYPAGTRSTTGIDSTYEPEPTTPNSYVAPKPGPVLAPGVSNPMADPKYIPTGEDFNFGPVNQSTGSSGTNTSNPVVVPQGNEDFLDQLPMAYGGYIPSYMAYGGYMPDYGYGGMMYYNPGGTVVGPNPDFAGPQNTDITQDKNNNNIPDYMENKDGNLEYTLEEQNAWTWDKPKTARNINKGLDLTTDILNAASFAKSREKEMPEVMYAQDIDRQLAYKGVTRTNDGIDPKAGFETGRTFTGKYGGSKYKDGGGTYSKGKVYSLTMDEIREIQRNGGSVKFLK